MAPSNRDRQRAAARARLEREMTERAQAVRRQRRLRLQIAGTVLAVVLVAVVVTVVAESGGGKKKKPTAAGPSASASPAACAWQPRLQANPSAPPQPTPSGVKDVGTPPKSGEPRSGTQTMTIDTNLGPITVAVDDSKVPCTARSFSYLAEKHFFDNTQCHRMTNSGLYVLQCGDPSTRIDVKHFPVDDGMKLYRPPRQFSGRRCERSVQLLQLVAPGQHQTSRPTEQD